MVPINTYVLPVKNLTEEDIEKEFSQELYERGSQCGSCKGYRAINEDYGVCFLKDSILKYRTVFEHFTCKKWVYKRSKNVDNRKLKSLLEILELRGIYLCQDEIYSLEDHEDKYIISIDGDLILIKKTFDRFRVWDI